MKRVIFSILPACCFAIVLCIGPALAYTPPSPPPPSKNLYELIMLDKNLSKFAAMIEETGLKDTLSATGGEPITVFAPTNEALANISRDAMQRIEASATSLQSFVKYHIIAGSAVSSSAIQGRRLSLAAANGEAILFDGSDRTKPPKVGDGALVQADIGATNGVLHTISDALVPPSLIRGPAPPPAPKQPAPPVATVVPAPAQAAPPPAVASTTGSAVPPAKVRPLASTVTVVPAPATASPLPATTSTSGFELFGHRFGW